jgi:hypothetical protein
LVIRFFTFSRIGGQYSNLGTFFHKLGIIHRVACPHTHQQNGAVELKHRHIVEIGLTFLAHASVPFRFWSDDFFTASFLINRMPTCLLKIKTPIKQLFNEPTDYTFLKVFGCACWPHTRPYNQRKLEFHSQKCVFLGYSSQHKGYTCLHIPSSRLYISRDVVFDENVFPFSSTSTPSVSTPYASSPVLIDQFVDVAHAPILLPNHDAGTGRGVRLELLEEPISSTAAPTDQVDHSYSSSAPAAHVDHALCMAHACLPASAVGDAPTDRASSVPLLTGSGLAPAPPVCSTGLLSPGPLSLRLWPPSSSPGPHSSPSLSEHSAPDDGPSSPSTSPSAAPERPRQLPHLHQLHVS